MRLNNILLVFFLLFKNNLCEEMKKDMKMKKKSFDEELATKFQFQLFENFNGCKDLYIQEKNVVEKLMEVKQKLFEVKSKLSGFLKVGDKKDREDMLSDFRRNISATIRNINEFLEVETNEYPTDSDVNGSIKAMFILHYSYYLNMTAAVHDGKLSYKDHHGMLREYQAYEKLHLNDVGVLADKALENRDYALSIDLIRVIIPMLKQYKGRDVTAIYI